MEEYETEAKTQRAFKKGTMALTGIQGILVMLLNYDNPNDEPVLMYAVNEFSEFLTCQLVGLSDGSFKPSSPPPAVGISSEPSRVRRGRYETTTTSGGATKEEKSFVQRFLETISFLEKPEGRKTPGGEGEEKEMVEEGREPSPPSSSSSFPSLPKRVVAIPPYLDLVKQPYVTLKMLEEFEDFCESVLTYFFKGRFEVVPEMTYGTYSEASSLIERYSNLCQTVVLATLRASMPREREWRDAVMEDAEAEAEEKEAIASGRPLELPDNATEDQVRKAKKKRAKNVKTFEDVKTSLENAEKDRRETITFLSTMRELSRSSGAERPKKVNSAPMQGGGSTINAATLRSMMYGEGLPEGTEELVIIDCRYPHEYNAGHIWGAINIWDPASLLWLFDPQRANRTRKCVFVFHCQFSVNRGPSSARRFSAISRDLTKFAFGTTDAERRAQWETDYGEFDPSLMGEGEKKPERWEDVEKIDFIPHIYILSGGYNEWFKGGGDNVKLSYPRCYVGERFSFGTKRNAYHHKYKFGKIDTKIPLLQGKAFDDWALGWLNRRISFGDITEKEAEVLKRSISSFSLSASSSTGSFSVPPSSSGSETLRVTRSASSTVPYATLQDIYRNEETRSSGSFPSNWNVERSRSDNDVYSGNFTGSGTRGKGKGKSKTRSRIQRTSNPNKLSPTKGGEERKGRSDATSAPPPKQRGSQSVAPYQPPPGLTLFTAPPPKRRNERPPAPPAVQPAVPRWALQAEEDPLTPEEFTWGRRMEKDTSNREETRGDRGFAGEKTAPAKRPTPSSSSEGKSISPPGKQQKSSSSLGPSSSRSRLKFESDEDDEISMVGEDDDDNSDASLFNFFNFNRSAGDSGSNEGGGLFDSMEEEEEPKEEKKEKKEEEEEEEPKEEKEERKPRKRLEF